MAPHRERDRRPSGRTSMPIRVLAPNPGPFTLEGTNTWVVGAGPALVIDPGPPDPEHIEAVRGQAGSIEAVLLTHRHPDHAGGAALLAERSGAPVLAFRPHPGEKRIRDGQAVEGGGVRVHGVHTPGHAPDHLCFHDRDSGALFTGDAVLGRGTSAICPPEGDMAAYMRSLAVMGRLGPTVIYPGHGPAAWSAAQKIEEYVDHRARREQQVLDGLAGDPRTPEELVASIYQAYPRELHAAAAGSILAHLVKLEREGLVHRVGSPADRRYSLSSPSVCARCGRPALPRSALCGRCSLAALQEHPGPAL